MDEPRILSLLKESEEQFVSGEVMAKRLGFTRAAVWKEIESLRRLGYQVEALPRMGYRLAGKPDKVYPWEVTYGLNTAFMGRTAYYYEETGSTNDCIKALLHKGACEGTIAVAEMQTKGRGRMGRQWHSTKGKGLWMSLLLQPTLPVTDIPKLTLMSVVALRKAIYQETGADAEIKWPNDLLLNGKKICGILAELGGEVDRMSHLVIGMGLNINQTLRDFPMDLREIATSLRIQLGRTVHRLRLIQVVLECLEQAYHQVNTSGFSEVLDECRKYSATLGRKVTIRDGARVLTGFAQEITNEGGLTLIQESGEKATVFSGDTSFLP
jgi:BirA family biotin operon repressor/biotin-[acetyl-CoA-carboxylase] ligase